MTFDNREQAGRRLADRLASLQGEVPVVLGLPRGGVPVAAVVARALHAPLDVIVVRKVGAPRAPELALGAIGEGGVVVRNDRVVAREGVDQRSLARLEAAERAELESRVRRFRGGRAPVPLTGRTAVLVDDGVATGATAKAACLVARAQGARRVVLAVPVASPEVLAELRACADQVVCLEQPEWLWAVGAAYRDFEQVGDEEVRALLAASRRGPSTQEVEVATRAVRLPGTLVVPDGADSVVAFAHGSGSSRRSPRNQQVARRLQRAGLATLLFDLLTSPEATDRSLVFDVELLAGRLLEATRWLRAAGGLGDCAVGYFGASTGAAAALRAAADPSANVAAVVSRGGRPDLAGDWLRQVTAPTLLIVGGEDRFVLELNRHARDKLSGEVQLAVVSGAGHLFVEPGALEKVGDLAADWFTRHLAAAHSVPSR